MTGTPAAVTPQPIAPERLGRKRAAFVSVLLSYAGLAFSILRGIVLVPLYFRYFSLSAYGSWLASANIVGLLGLLDLGFGTVFYQRLAEAFGAKDTARFARVAGCGLVITLATTPILILVGTTTASFVPGLINAEESLRRPLAITFALTAIGSALDLAWTNVAAATHAWQRTAVYGVARILVQCTEVIGTLASLWLGLGVVAMGVGALAGALVGAGYAIVTTVRLWRQLGLPKPTFDRAELRELVSTSIPVFMSRIVGHVAANIDVALVSALVNPAAAAVYGLTDRLFRVAVSAINPIAGSTLSPLAHLMGEVGPAGVARPLRELFATWSAVAALCFPALLAMNRDFVGIWVGLDKYGGSALSLAICVSALLSARSFLMYIVLTGLGEIATTAWLTIVEPAIRIPLMFLGLRFIGPAGLPLATGFGVGILSFAIYPWYVSRKIRLPRRQGLELQMRGFATVVVTMAIGALVARYAPSANRWPTFIGKAALVSIGLLSVTMATSRDTRDLLVRVFQQLKQRTAAGRT